MKAPAGALIHTTIPGGPAAANRQLKDVGIAKSAPLFETKVAVEAI